MTPDSSRWNADFGGFVEPPTLDRYATAFARYFAFDRRDGILEVRIHTDNGPALFSLGLKRALGQLWPIVGADPLNEVIILTGTGDHWIAGVDDESLAVMGRTNELPAAVAYEILYRDGVKLLETFLVNVDVPTIGVINGPGPRKELPLVCDLTICSDHATISDGNFALGGMPPGDGLHLVLQEVLGPKRAAYHLYTGSEITAPEALRLGLVNEVWERERLPERAWELAAQVKAKPAPSRHLAHSVISRPWKRRISDDLGFGLAHVGLAARSVADGP